MSGDVEDSLDEGAEDAVDAETTTEATEEEGAVEDSWAEDVEAVNENSEIVK